MKSAYVQTLEAMEMKMGQGFVLGENYHIITGFNVNLVHTEYYTRGGDKKFQDFSNDEARRLRALYLNTQCQYCGVAMKRKVNESPIKEEDPLLACLIAIGRGFHEDVCDDEECQSRLQHDCDQFDSARKGE